MPTSNNLKSFYPKLKIVARGSTIKAYGAPEVLDEFQKRVDLMQMHLGKYNTLDEKIIERIVTAQTQAELGFDSATEKVILHGVGGKIIKAKHLTKQSCGCNIEKRYGVCHWSSRNGKTYTGVAMAVKALKEKQVKQLY